MADYIVTSGADSGAGTLRDLIGTANLSSGPDAISYDESVVTTVDADLPVVTEALTITGAVLSLSNDVAITSTASLGLEASIAGNGFHLTFGGSGPIALTGEVSGVLNLVKTGAGILTLGAASSHTGLTSIQGGYAVVTNATALGGTAIGTVVENGGTLRLANVDIDGEELLLRGEGDSGNGVLQGSGVSSHSGAILLDSAAIRMTAAAAGSLTLSGEISSSGDTVLTKANSGTLVLSGANTFTGSVTIATGTVQLSGGSALADTVDVNVSNGTLALNDDETIDRLSGTVAGTVSLGSGTLTLGQSGDTTFSGAITGSGGLSKGGAGQLILAGTNTYTGDTTISDGTLRLSGGAALSDSSDVVIDGGALDLNGASETIGALSGTGGNLVLGAGTLTVNQDEAGEYAGVVAGAGSLTKDGTETLTLSGANTFSGGVAVYDGALSVSATANLGAGGVTLAGGGLVLTGSSAITTAITVSQDFTLTDAGTGQTLSGVISGVGDMTIAADGGTGLTLSATNTRTGATTIQDDAILIVSGGNALSNGHAVTVEAGGELRVAATETVGGLAGGAGGVIAVSAGASLSVNQAGDTVFAGNLEGAGGLRKLGAGELTLSGVNTHAGTTVVLAGTLTLSGGHAIRDNGVIQVDATLDLGGEDETTGTLTGAASGRILLGEGTLTVNQATSPGFAGVIEGSGGLAKAGAGTLTLSGANTYTGETTVEAGTLALSGGAALADSSDVVIDGGALDLNGTSETIGALSGTGGNLLLGAGTLTVNQDEAGEYAGVISGTGGLVKAGADALTLSGANTYTGLTTVSAGTLIANSNTALGTTAGGTIVSDGATLEFQISGSIIADALTLNGDGVDDGGALRSTSSGTTTYSGAITLGSDARIVAATGTMALSGGISGVDYDLTVGGPISISGGLALGAGALTKVDAGNMVISSVNTSTGLITVAEGSLTVTNAAGLGATTGGTVVEDGATLTIRGGITVGAEALTLNGDGAAGTGALLNGTGANAFGGAITLASDAVIGAGAGTLTLTGGVTSADYDLTVAGAGNVVLSSAIALGDGGLTKVGAGTLTLSAANTYAGTTTFNGGVVNLGMANTLSAASDVVFGADALGMNMNGFDQSIGSLSSDDSDADIALSGATLSVDQSADLQYRATISGTGGLIKDGVGELFFRDVQTFTGETIVAEGRLRSEADLATTSVTVMDGGDLAGTGNIAGTVTVEAGGRLLGGTNASGLGTGALVLASEAIFEAEVDDLARFDRAYVSGTVNLGGATLDLRVDGGFAPTVGDEFVIVDNDLADAIVGTFDGLAEGASIDLAGFRWFISYVGGDGNDVELSVKAIPSAPVDPGPQPPVGPTPGDDRLNLRDDQLLFDALDGDDYVIGGGGPNTILGGEGNDSLFGGAGDDVLGGGVGSNYLRGGEGQDSLTGGDAFDDLHGNIGDDTVRGGGGGDWVVGGQGSDALFGDDGGDVVLGNLGGDVLDGGTGNDIVRGGQANDSVMGGLGDDWLSGDRGSDTLSGGLGADTFHSWADAGLDIVIDFNVAEGDRVNLLAGSTYAVTQVGADTVIDVTGGAQLVLQNVQFATLGEGWLFVA